MAGASVGRLIPATATARLPTLIGPITCCDWVTLSESAPDPRTRTRSLSDGPSAQLGT